MESSGGSELSFFYAIKFGYMDIKDYICNIIIKINNYGKF